jgi:hypothetical protein
MVTLETERSVRKAIESLSQARAHIQMSDTLDVQTKQQANEMINDLEELVIVGWAKTKAA